MMRVPLFDELNDEWKKKVMTKNIRVEDGRLYWQRQYPGLPYTKKGEDVAAPKFIELSESTNPKDSAVTISVDNDLAVISLRMRLSELSGRIFMNESIFVEELLMLGYYPVTIDEIAQGPSYEGADIFTVGYPSGVSQVMTREEIKGKFEEYFSIDVTLPCFTFGKISMANESLPYFWADLRIYVGNSGCPVVENNKIVGIVTHGAVIEGDNEWFKIPFAKATKTKLLPDLLEEQLRKDEVFTDPETLPIRFPGRFMQKKLNQSKVD
jgi:CBS domain-containing protein